jgi:hypothetical protein
VTEELGKQVEKAICRKVLGMKSRIHSLILLQVEKGRINSQPERELPWEDFVKQVRWTDRLEQIVVTLKESFAGHPTLDTKNKPITKDYVHQPLHKNFAPKPEDLADALRLVEILDELNGAFLFVL